MKKAGFTLVEMIVVLFLTALIFSLSVPASFAGLNEWQHRRFWNEMKQEWQLAQVRSQQQHQLTEINYDNVNHEIIFQFHNRRDRVVLPKNLKVQKSYECRMLSTGYVKPGTWIFIDQQHQQEIRMIIQMAGGGYRIEKRRLYPE